MYRLEYIKEAFRYLVGWERPYEYQASGDWCEMEESESHLIYNDAHPLLTTQNIKSIMPEDFILRYPEWDANATYYKNMKVHKGKIVYRCLDDNETRDPADGFGWIQYPMYWDYLMLQVDKGTTQLMQRFFADKAIANESRSLLERRTFFDGAGRINATLANRGNLVGFEIVPVRSMGVTTKIERIGFQGTGGSGNITLYLFHSSQINPVNSVTINYQANATFQWFTLEDFYLPYIGEHNNSGGSWYLMYNQDDLPQGLEAINVSKDWSREPCGTCNIGSVQAWRELTKYIQISPFCTSAPSTFAEFPELPDVETLKYTNTSNYGLNVEVSVGCDLTEFIVMQKQIFANALQLQVAYNLLRTMAMNPDVRVNRNQSNVDRMDILYELDGNTQGRKTGLGVALDNAYKAIELETRGIDRICLSCNNHGVKYRTV